MTDKPTEDVPFGSLYDGYYEVNIPADMAGPKIIRVTQDASGVSVEVEPDKTPVLPEPVAWRDDGSTRAGSTNTSFRVVTAETKADMPKASAANFNEPLYSEAQMQALADRLAVLQAALEQMYGPLSIAALEARATTAEATLAEAEPVKVRELEWIEEEPEWWGATSLGAVYEVRRGRKGVRVRGPDTDGFNDFDGTIDEAKRFFQDEHSSRIRSALEGA